MKKGKNKTKEEKHTKPGVQSKIIWNICIFFCIAIIILGTVLWDYYSLWAYMDFSFLKNSSAEITPTNTKTSTAPLLTTTPSPIPTPNKAHSPTLTPIPTPTPTATPIPHPGDRDGKFTQGEIIIGDNSYHSQDLSIEISKYYENEITYFVAEVYVRDMDNFFAAFAGGKYGTRKEVTSKMAQDNNAIFAVSGDYYNAREGGLIVRNSVQYRNGSGLYNEVLAIYNDGSMKGFSHKDAYSGELAADENVVHTYVFGPILLTGGELAREWTDRNYKIRHPRVGIGMVEPYHYYFILADGRKQGYSIGISLPELTDLFIELECTEAYNLDGGGSATMIFLNELVNLPQGTTKERAMGDCICFIETNSTSTE